MRIHPILIMLAVEEPRHYIENVMMDDLATINIRLPHEGKGKTWIKHDDRYWYFNEPAGP